MILNLHTNSYFFSLIFICLTSSIDQGSCHAINIGKRGDIPANDIVKSDNSYVFNQQMANVLSEYFNHRYKMLPLFKINVDILQNYPIEITSSLRPSSDPRLSDRESHLRHELKRSMDANIDLNTYPNFVEKVRPISEQKNFIFSEKQDEVKVRKQDEDNAGWLANDVPEIVFQIKQSSNDPRFRSEAEKEGVDLENSFVIKLPTSDDSLEVNDLKKNGVQDMDSANDAPNLYSVKKGVLRADNNPKDFNVPINIGDGHMKSKIVQIKKIKLRPNIKTLPGQTVLEHAKLSMNSRAHLLEEIIPQESNIPKYVNPSVLSYNFDTLQDSLLIGNQGIPGPNFVNGIPELSKKSEVDLSAGPTIETYKSVRPMNVNKSKYSRTQDEELPLIPRPREDLKNREAIYSDKLDKNEKTILHDETIRSDIPDDNIASETRGVKDSKKINYMHNSKPDSSDVQVDKLKFDPPTFEDILGGTSIQNSKPDLSGGYEILSEPHVIEGDRAISKRDKPDLSELPGEEVFSKLHVVEEFQADKTIPKANEPVLPNLPGEKMFLETRIIDQFKGQTTIPKENKPDLYDLQTEEIPSKHHTSEELQVEKAKDNSKLDESEIEYEEDITSPPRPIDELKDEDILNYRTPALLNLPTAETVPDPYLNKEIVSKQTISEKSKPVFFDLKTDKLPSQPLKIEEGPREKSISNIEPDYFDAISKDLPAPPSNKVDRIIYNIKPELEKDIESEKSLFDKASERSVRSRHIGSSDSRKKLWYPATRDDSEPTKEQLMRYLENDRSHKIINTKKAQKQTRYGRSFKEMRGRGYSPY